MAKRKDHSGMLFVILFVVAGIWTWIKTTYAQVSTWVVDHWVLIVSVGVAVVVGRIMLSVAAGRAAEKKHQDRLGELRAKYGDESVVQRILNNEFWFGATEEMLLDSLGVPDDKDSEVMKRKTKETWKYGWKQGNQYRLRIYLDNGKVIKWEQKG